jgi:AcrR family transcriptional regulator
MPGGDDQYGYSLAMSQEASRGPASAGPRGTGRPARKQPARPSLGGGAPAQDRELRAQGRETVRRLLEAGMVEFENRGFHGVRVDDVVRRAGISHGTFYLYFSNKEDLFKALLKDALHDMEIVAGDFPVVTSDETGLSVLRQWVRKFFRAYAAHATVIRILSQADLVPEEVFGDGLQLFFSIAESMTTGMTAAAEAAGRHQERAELTAVACLMMLERVNYLISAEVQLPADDMADRIADIIFAAFGLAA